MVDIIGLRGEAEKGAEDPGNIEVESGIFLFKKGAMGGAVEHEDERAQEETGDSIVKKDPPKPQIFVRSDEKP
jgi:hypothetical protein